MKVLSVLLTAAAAAAVAVTAPAHAAGPAGWVHPGFDAEDSHYNPSESAINASTVGELQPRWTAPLRLWDGACGRSETPVVAGRHAVLADQMGISAHDTLNGQVKWRFDWTDPEDSGTPKLAVDGNVVIAANSRCQSNSDPDGAVTALGLADGKVKWRIFSDMPVDTAVVDKGLVVISGESPSDELATVAYRVSDGKQVWRKVGYLSSGVSANGKVLATRGTSTSALALTTGAILWTKPNIWYGESASPAGDRFLVTAGAALTSVNAANGAVTWTAPGKASTLLASDGRRVYRAGGRTMEALNAATGKRIWLRPLPADAEQPMRAGGLLYTGGPILNAATGAVVSSGAAVRGRQVVTGGRLLTVRGSTLGSFAP